MNVIENQVQAILTLAYEMSMMPGPITHQQAYRRAEEVFMRTGLGTDWDRTFLWDALEVMAFMQTVGRWEAPTTEAEAVAAFEALRQLGAELPTHTARTAEQVEFQQFSTPRHYAFAAMWLANLRPAGGQERDLVLEPSAGLGGLCAFPLKFGPPVVANEGEPRRHRILQRLAKYVETCDAAQLTVLQPTDAEHLYAANPDLRPTVVIMNPPFASNGLTGIKDKMIAARHIERALAQLAEGGRLVAIGPGGIPQYGAGGMGFGAPGFKEWWKRIGERYCVRANWCISGDEYKKSGTTTQTRLIVIDKVGPTVQWPAAGPKVHRLEELWPLFAGIRALRGQKPEIIAPLQPATAPNPFLAKALANMQQGSLGEVQGKALVKGEIPNQPTTDELEEIEQARRELEMSQMPHDEEPPWEVAAKDEEEAYEAESPTMGDPISQVPNLLVTREASESREIPAGFRQISEHEFWLASPAGQKASAEERRLREIAAANPNTVICSIPKPVPNEPEKEIPKPEDENQTVFPDRQPPLPGEQPAAEVDQQLGAAVLGEPDHSEPVSHDQATEAAPAVAEEPAPLPVAGEEDLPAAHDDEQGVFRGYKPFLQLTGAVGHPAPLVESEAMRMVEPPVPKANVLLPFEAVKSGRISAAQIERVVYAVHATNQRLSANAEGVESPKSFLIGDGTGFGKGTTLAAIGMHFRLTGAKRILWLSKSANLIADARRDWEWVGGVKEEVFAQESQKHPEIKRDGIMFSTYTMMSRRQVATEEKWDTDATGAIQGKKSKVKLKGVDRFQQILDWKPEVILMDESHEMGNAVSQKGKRGTKKASQKALAGIDLQQQLPEAKIIFASATAATEVHNLAYAAERLGLCGPQVPAFPDLDSFITKVAAGGMLVMELVAKDMKALGLYQATNLSYAGTSFELLEHTLTPEQREMYDDACEAWRTVMVEMERAMAINGSDSSADVKKYVKGQYYGAMQRFFNQLLTSMKTPTMISDMEAELEAGHSCVVQLVNTNEAATERAVAAAASEGESLDDLDITPRDTLMNVVKTVFPVTLYETYADEKGNVRTRPVVDAHGDPMINPEAVQMREELLLKIACIRVPQGCLDMLIDHFGLDNVAEITGRSARYVLDGGHRVRESRSNTKCNAEAAEFNDGKRRILVFSGAGNTGRSFHADLRYQNQQLRIHYVAQAGWRADEALQGLGRTHRTNEAQPPHYKLVTTDLKGEKRFVTSIARRIEQLGSLTKGDRKAASGGLFSDADNLETEYSAEAVWTFFKTLLEGHFKQLEITEYGKLKQRGLSFEEVTAQMGLVNLFDPETGALSREKMPGITQFLNRLLCLSCAIQDTVFNQWFEILQGCIEHAKEQGTFDRGVEKIYAEQVVKVREVDVHRDRDTNARTKVVELALRHRVGYATWEMVGEGQYVTPSLVGYASAFRAPDGFYQNRKSGRVFAYFKAGMTTLHKTGDVVESVRRVYPTGYMRYNAVELKGLGDVPIPREEAEKLWRAELARLPEYKEETVYLLTGAILPVWEKIVTREMRIQQAETDTGERFIGCVIPPETFGETMRNLGAVHDGVYRSPEQLFHGILHQGWKVQLANGYYVRHAQVAGRQLVMIGNVSNYREIEALKQQGIVRSEFLGNKPIVYLVHADMSDYSGLERLLEARPPVLLTERNGQETPLLKEPPVEQEAAVAEEDIRLGGVSIDEMVKLVPLPTDNRAEAAPATLDFEAKPETKVLVETIKATGLAVASVTEQDGNTHIRVERPAPERAADERVVVVKAPAVLSPSKDEAQQRIREMMQKAKELGKKTDVKHYQREAAGQISLF